MALLERCSPVRLKDRRDHWQKRPELRLLDRLRACVARRQREPTHLGDRLSAQPEDPSRLTPGLALDEHELPNGCVDFHDEHPRLLSKEKPLHWPAFTPPASAQSRRSSGWFCHRPTHI